MDEMLARGRHLLQLQPFSALLRAELRAYSPGRAEVSVPIRDELTQQHGFLHGGVVSFAAENALVLAGRTALGPNVVTAEFKINYLRPAIGESILARAVVIHAGKTLAVCCCDVFVIRDGKEILCAAAQGTIAHNPAFDSHK